MQPVRLIILGAGARGQTFARFAEKFPERATVVGVAEPREHYRETMAARFSIPRDHVFMDWRQAVQQRKFADAVLICMQDAMHAEPAIACAKLGYHIFLEKPMAPKEEECRRVVAAVKKAGVVFSVGHVLRYTPVTCRLKKLITDGVIGEVASIQMLEPVGYWHQAHSFVRGNWRSEAESSFMLLSKSCHFIDLIRHFMGKRCVSVASYGSLFHFRKEKKPSGAADRCLDCPVEPNCPYSAKRFYLSRVEKGIKGWPTDVLTPVVTLENVTEALRKGPYGRCVYACDNDVVDHQVVIMRFVDGTTANFTMTAFTGSASKSGNTRIFGTRGSLADLHGKIQHNDFLTDEVKEIDPGVFEDPILGGHGGGDGRLIADFIYAVAEGNPARVLTGPDETLESHLMVFAAERSRREGREVAVE